MKIKFILTIFISLLFYSHALFAQWQTIAGPYGIETSSTVLFDSLYFAATSKGLTVSNDFGQNWTFDNVSLNGTNSKIIYKENKFIYDRAFNTQGGMLSLDSGITWNQMTSAGAYHPIKYDISIGKIYVWCTYGFLFYSDNNGMTWNTINPTPSTNNINDFAVDNGRIYVSKSSFGTGVGNIYYSDNNGLNWQTLPTTGISGSSLEAYQILPNNNQIYLKCLSGLYKSVDGGNTWNLFDTGLPLYYNSNGHITHINISKNNIYVSVTNNGGLFQSDTSNASFINISQGLPLEAFVNSVSENQTFLYGSSLSGVFRTDKTSINWQLFQNGISFESCNALAVADTNLFVGTRNGFHVSHNNGNSFVAVPVGETTNNFYKINNNVYASCAQGYKSSDGGYSWSSLNYLYGYFALNLKDFCIVNNNYFGLNIDQTLRISIDSGITWNTVNGIPVATANCIAENNGRLFVGTSNGIYKSLNNGASWNISLAGNSISRIKVENGIIYAAGIKVWVSFDNGNTWIDTNYPGTSVVAFAVKSNFLIVSPGLYYTNDYGTSWNFLSAPTPPNQSGPTALCLNDSFLFAGYYDTLYRFPSSILTDIDQISTRQNIIQISPNPVADNLHVRFLDNEIFDSNLKIKIHDVTGKTLFEKQYNSVEQRVIELNFKNFSKGVYLLDIITDIGRTVKKIVKE